MKLMALLAINYNEYDAVPLCGVLRFRTFTFNTQGYYLSELLFLFDAIKSKMERT